jgi:uncharacterized protein YjbJ (UPF0337 family)
MERGGRKSNRPAQHCIPQWSPQKARFFPSCKTAAHSGKRPASLALLLLYQRLSGVWSAARMETNRKWEYQMNTFHIKGDWNIIKGKLKQKYAQLTDNDLRYEEGREDELVGRIQKRTGDTKEAVEQFIDECFRG